jgi:hypothetical protein
MAIRITDGMTKNEIFEFMAIEVCRWNRVEYRVVSGSFQINTQWGWESADSIGQLAELLNCDIDTDYLFDVVFGGNL